LLALLPLLLLLLSFQSMGTAEGAPASLAPAVTSSDARHFYVTDFNVATDATLTACSIGYHMASMWEILDPSNLVYNFAHPDAHTKADSGHGPPSFWYGWVRTGQSSSNANTGTFDNCNNWTSTSASDTGVSVRLTRTWETPPAEIGGIWDATDFSCNFTGPVWCVKNDINYTYLPLLNR
jgi:hypothetical protein